MGKSPAIPPPIWKKPSGESEAVDRYQVASSIMYSIPDFTTWGLFTFPFRQCEAKMFAEVLSSHPRTNIGRFFSQAATSRLSAGLVLLS